MNRRIVFGIFLALVLIAGAVSIGVYAYNLGIAQNLAQSGNPSNLAPGTGISPYPYYGPFGFHPFGFRFFGCFGPLLFFFFIFFLFRLLWWGGRWGHGPGWRHAHWDKGVPPMFDEWHRQAHEQGTQKPQTPEQE